MSKTRGVLPGQLGSSIHIGSTWSQSSMSLLPSDDGIISLTLYFGNPQKALRVVPIFTHVFASECKPNHVLDSNANDSDFSL